jgi:hypothetical protein
MWQRVVGPGLLGGLAFFLAVFVVDAVLGFSARFNLNPVPNEDLVYEVLKENVTEPGRYVANPPLTEERTFPDGEPVFSILYGGVGHETAGREALLKLPLFFVLPVLAAGMLSLAGGMGRSSYWRRVLFFVGVGVLVGATSHLTRFGIGSDPLGKAVALALHDVGLWVVAGLVMAWRIKPSNA